jgi:hypothetical protein
MRYARRIATFGGVYAASFWTKFITAEDEPQLSRVKRIFLANLANRPNCLRNPFA